MATSRRYRHFCPMARALEAVGDRWGLLVVRDLMHGPRRFTDLLDTCGGITPKQLATQLRQLRDVGVVVRDQQEGRREVWYDLSPSGRELTPVVDHLLLWGIRHAAEAPSQDEPIHPFHVLNGTRVALANAGRVPPAPLAWVWRMGASAFTLRYDGHRWTLEDTADPAADVVVDTTASAWAEFVMTPPDRRDLRAAAQLHGEQAAVDTFADFFPAG
jgi:DNA-binding HxlR family transcriptional regulator